MDVITVLAAQTLLAMLGLEGIKQLLFLKWKNLNIDPRWYAAALPVLSFLVLPIASWLAGNPFSVTVWTEDTLRQVIYSALTSIASMFVYDNTLLRYKSAVSQFKAYKDFMKSRTFAEVQEVDAKAKVAKKG